MYFNGDTRLPYPVHIQTVATASHSRSELIEIMVGLCVEACLVPGLVADLPAKNKWGSMAHSLSHQVAGSIGGCRCGGGGGVVG
eukprot:1665074-Alexandrium_andersonii.AAC.1